MKKVKIALIDSGVDPQIARVGQISKCYNIVMKDGVYQCIDVEPKDEMGHGSAVATIIYNQNNNIELVSISVNSVEFEYDEDALISALQFIEGMEVDIVNISAGVTYLTKVQQLEKVCCRIASKGVIIVSAFDNDGAISYPAALPDVIGVDVTSEYDNRNDIIYQENSIVDLLVSDRFFRTVWQGEKTIIRGTSFATAYITGKISKLLSEIEGGIISKKVILNMVSTKNRTIKKSIPLRHMPHEIKKAIIFPLNKESSALLRFRNNLSFDIVGVYDSRVSGNIGKAFDDLHIRNFDEIDWEDDFDTVIVSCYKTLSRLSKRDYSSEILEYAKRNNKKIVSFEKIEGAVDESFYYPEVSQEEVPLYNAGKMHKISVPVVGVYGTSSKQGKYTLQVELRNRINQIGYQTGFLATEPSGCLLGADYTFHFGYHAFYNRNSREMIATLNQMIWEIQKEKKDLVITGCQSGTLHYDDSLVDNFAIYQYAFMLGTSPDYIVLCVNPHDDMEYVDRTINYLNAVNNGKVESIVIFPVEVKEAGAFDFKKERHEISGSAMMSIKEKLYHRYGKPVYAINDKNDLDMLVNQILESFMEE